MFDNNLPLTGPLLANTAMGWFKLSAKLWIIKTKPWFAFSDDLVSKPSPKSSRPLYVKVLVFTEMLYLKNISSNTRIAFF